MTLTGLQAAPDLRIASTFNSEEVKHKNKKEKRFIYVVVVNVG